jgi:hypothetical protein
MHTEVAREAETRVDFLAPYFARIGNPEQISYDQALEMRENCTADFRQLLLDRNNRIQEYIKEVIMRLLLVPAYHFVTKQELYMLLWKLNQEE